MERLNSQFLVNFAFCVLNLVFFCMNPTNGVSLLNLIVAGFCGYWAYEAIKGV